MAPLGLELPPKTTGKTGDSETGGAQCGALPSDIDPELAEIIGRWDDIPEPIRAGVMALVRASRNL